MDTSSETENPAGTAGNGGLDPAEIARLDAQYTPIDLFSAWSDLRIDQRIWSRQLSFLEDQRATLKQEDLERALAVAMRAAAVDTGAIEGLYETDRGLTYTIAVQEAAWQTKMRARDERIPDFFEAQLAAYDLASEIASSARPITEVWIREVHQVVTRPQGEYEVETSQGRIRVPLPKGQYKQHPNHVKQADETIHVYAPVDLTPAEMHRLVEELNSAQFASAHPVIQTAYAHYCLVAIHAFADGNGRVARAVASVFLRRQASIPLLIWFDQRPEYLDALEAADHGDRQAFVDFVSDRAIDTFGLVANEIGPGPEDYIPAISKLYESYGGLKFEELDQKAAEIMQHTVTLAQEVVRELDIPAEIGITSDSGGRRHQPSDPATYRDPLQGAAVARVVMTTRAPAQATVQLDFQVFIAQKERARYAFRLESPPDSGPAVDIRLKDVRPAISAALSFHVRSWVRRRLIKGLAELKGKAEDARRTAGF